MDVKRRTRRRLVKRWPMQPKPYCCSMPMTIAPAPMPANTMHHFDTCTWEVSLQDLVTNLNQHTAA